MSGRLRSRCLVAALSITGVSGSPAAAGTLTIGPSDDTFINSANPSNDNGGSSSLFTGTDGHGGLMRGLVRFDMPAGIRAAATVTSVQLRMTVAALGDGTAGTPATEALQAITQTWTEGNGTGTLPGTLTVGQTCGGAITGATWTQNDCIAGTNWTAAGGAVTAAITAIASTAGVGIGAPVLWDSAGNPALIADVQSWVDSAAGNRGWRITSSTEAMTAEAQRFGSRESATAPALTIAFTCRAGYTDTGSACVAAAGPVPASSPLALALLAVFLVLAAPRSAPTGTSPDRP